MSAGPFRARRLRRRSGWGWLLLAAFVIVPILEIYVIIRVGQVIGAWWTILLLIADSIFGAWLVKREGRRAWRALTSTIQSGRMPSTELADAALILVGGTLMMSPGFVTDVFGIVLILPFTRPLARVVLTRYLARRLLVVRAAGTGSQGSEGPVVRGEVVDDDR
ncbi:MAG TPA: FxsA family protein [Nocardioides sp.]|jgi:UPF0716 protein FxsA|uniref:FxsA family protein n=1 Tax=Nocardioides sp. TaxID=35761 RepID=UPI002E3251E2|nr:FxsA family protein [Nocardioides sp.]HEX3931658.1 FxsA family protein [Nocardioides sp.]